MEDRDLLERARTGDEPALSRLFLQHQRQIFQYAAYMCGSGSADDIVQETFLVVLRQTGRRDAPIGSVRAYLIGIARHLVMKRHGRGSEWAVDEAVLEQTPSEEPSAFDRVAAAQSIDALRGAVRSLPPAYREAIVLCELQEMDYSVAATLLNCPVGTVRSRLHRGRALLATKLAASMGEEVERVR
jgi:RNA polymerase sigma-70 factor (ECF subfamily)